MYTMVFFLRYPRCQKKVKGGGGTYILLLFFILPLSLFFSPGWTYYFPSCLYILYTYIYQCVYKMMLILTKTRFFSSGKIHTQRDKGKDRDL